MKDKFTIDFDYLTNQLSTERIYKLADVQDRIEKVAYDIVRFRDNKDTDQLWKIEDRADGPVIIALYGDDGALLSESSETSEWDAIPDKTAMNIFYKGESVVALSEKELGIPKEEFPLVKKWLPKKLASSIELQNNLFNLMTSSNKELVVKRFPELKKAAQLNTEQLTDSELPKTEPVVSSLLTQLQIPTPPLTALKQFVFAQQVKKLFFPTPQAVEQLVQILRQSNIDLNILPILPEVKQAIQIIKNLYDEPEEIQNFIYALYRSPSDLEDVKRQQRLADMQSKV